MKKLFPPIVYNTITLTGIAVFIISFGLILFLTVIELLATETKPYMGIITFIVLPFFMLIGVLLMFYGIKRERKLIKKGYKRERTLPVIDLNNPVHRKLLLYFSSGLLFLILFSAFGSFKAYEYTDSNEFCGTICHKVMNPEYTSYEYSPHARVDCVKCHIGPGAQWYVRSKLSGAYQLYAVLFNKYPKPIPIPISNLRPAQETCEQCHWPKVFFSEKMLKKTYYMSDDENSHWSIDLLLKIGGGNIESGPTSGIHWHMNIDNKIEYYASDERRQVIPWIKSTNEDGIITIYRSTEDDFDESKMDKDAIRRMDCIDCHNRPSHLFRNPSGLVNELMSIGWIDASLPDIKSTAVDALDKGYSTKANGLDSIEIIIRSYYESNYPRIAIAKKEEIKNAIAELKKVYKRNYFPSMDVDWTKYPDNIGHLYSKGCFRCHDGKHVSEDGKVLTRDCNACHIILAQKFENSSIRISLGGVNYKHPVDISEAWKDTNCSECHGD
ncbi:MAG: cytochrome C [Chlorobi bacterium]|nr:cytochrome C [Chlorobiota bacterium]